MYQFAENFYKDLGPLSHLPFEIFFRRVADMPYRCDDDLFPEDPRKIVEVVARPAHLLNSSIFPGLDCKKKSVLLGAWSAANGRPFRFLAVSERPDGKIHHVFPDIDLLGRGWTSADATFQKNKIGQVFPLTFAEELQR